MVWWYVVVSGAFFSLGILRAKITHAKITHAKITHAKITHAQFIHAQSLAHIHILQIINAGQKIAL